MRLDKEGWQHAPGRVIVTVLTPVCLICAGIPSVGPSGEALPGKLTVCSRAGHSPCAHSRRLLCSGVPSVGPSGEAQPGGVVPTTGGTVRGIQAAQPQGVSLRAPDLGRVDCEVISSCAFPR